MFSLAIFLQHITTKTNLLSTNIPESTNRGKA